MPETRLRLTKIDELQFLTCVKHQVWGSQMARFKNWHKNDYLAFIVNKSLAGIAQVSDAPYVSREQVWDNGAFPHRVPLRFLHVIPRDERQPILGSVRDALIAAWGARWGLGILNQNVLLGAHAQTLIEAVCERPNALSGVQSDIDALIVEARREREAKSNRKQSRPIALQTAVAPTLPNTPARDKAEHSTNKGDDAVHANYQDLLVRLGKVTGCSVWIASNDKGRQFKGKALGDGCLRDLPNMGLSKEATDRISLIDVIWIQKHAPVCAFEVEATTPVFSGLLRMSDLLAVVPALNVKLFIVAPRERQSKVMKELDRPTFQKIGLSDYCRFLPGEDLQALLAKVQDLDGHVNVSVLEKLAVELPSELD